MKLIYVAIDGMGDLPLSELGEKTPLEAAETPNMNFLAQNGKMGLMYSVGKGVAPESDVAVISLLGYDPLICSTGRGIIEAVGAGLNVEDGDLALRCNFATIGQGDKILDRRVARTLTNEEAKELSDFANEEVKLETIPTAFEFRPTLGHRAALLIKNKGKALSAKITNSDPAYVIKNGLGVASSNPEMILKKCKPMENTQEARISADLVNEFIEKTRLIWENHPVNEKRSASGKLKANVVLTRDAGDSLPKFFNINQKYNLRFAALVDMHAERGIAKLAGMHAILLPPPTKKLEEDYKIRVERLVSMLPYYDCFYIHLKGPDVPGHDGNCHLKAKIISAIDKHFFGRFLDEISVQDYIICITADHATPCALKVHSDTPVPVLISDGKKENKETVKFSERSCKEGKLGILAHGYELMPKLVDLLGK